MQRFWSCAVNEYAQVKSARSASSLSLDVFTIAHIAALKILDIEAHCKVSAYVQCRSTHQKGQTKLDSCLHLKIPERKCRDHGKEDISECRIRCDKLVSIA